MSNEVISLNEVSEVVDNLILLVEKLSKRISHLEQRMGDLETLTLTGTYSTSEFGKFTFYCKETGLEIPIIDGNTVCPERCIISKIGKCPLNFDEEVEN